MSVESAVAAGRLAAESRMTSRATVRRDTGATTTVDGLEVPVWAVMYSELPIRLGGADRGGSGTRLVRVGETEVQLAVRVASVPALTDDLRDKDLIEITSGDNDGAVFKIVESTFQDQATARRVPVVEWQRPEEWT